MTSGHASSEQQEEQDNSARIQTSRLARMIAKNLRDNLTNGYSVLSPTQNDVGTYAMTVKDGHSGAIMIVTVYNAVHPTKGGNQKTKP
jgi:hypothetical protein